MSIQQINENTDLIAIDVGEPAPQTAPVVYPDQEKSEWVVRRFNEGNMPYPMNQVPVTGFISHPSIKIRDVLKGHMKKHGEPNVFIGLSAEAEYGMEKSLGNIVITTKSTDKYFKYIIPAVKLECTDTVMLYNKFDRDEKLQVPDRVWDKVMRMCGVPHDLFAANKKGTILSLNPLLSSPSSNGSSPLSTPDNRRTTVPDPEVEHMKNEVASMKAMLAQLVKAATSPPPAATALVAVASPSGSSSAAAPSPTTGPAGTIPYPSRKRRAE